MPGLDIANKSIWSKSACEAQLLNFRRRLTHSTVTMPLTLFKTNPQGNSSTFAWYEKLIQEKSLKMKSHNGFTKLTSIQQKEMSN